MKRLVVIIAMMCLLAQLAACSVGSNKPEILSGEDKIELVLASDGRSAVLSAMVNSFNQKSENYRIRLEYYNLNADKTVEHLRTEIIAGSAPDIYVFSQDVFSDVKMSLYEDLLPYLDADPVYSRACFVPGLYEAMTQGGSLCYLPSEFFINSFTARASVVGDRTGLTMEEAVQLAEELGPGITVFPAWSDRLNVMNDIVSFSIRKFVDFADGTCDFLNPEFLGLLELCKAHPESPPEDYSGTSLLSYSLLQTFDAFVGLHYEYGRDYSFVGFPTQDRKGSTFQISQRFSISSVGEHKEAAWEFIRMVLDEENQANTEFFPVIQSELNRQMESAQAENERNPEAKLEAYDIEQFDALINSITVIEDNTDIALYKIIAEEADAYFSGARTAEAAAEIIQSRVSLYLAERS